VAETTYGDLDLLVPSLKRFIAVPGGFAALFPSTTDTDLSGCLADGFARAQLDGFFIGSQFGHDLDLTTNIVTPDLTLREGALVVLYAGKRLVQAQLLNLKTATKYEAKGLIYDVQQAASVLTTLLKDYTAELDRIVQQARTSNASSAFVMADAYFIRATGWYRGYGGQLGEDRAYDYNAYDPLLLP
jgi:hypothetical protein